MFNKIFMIFIFCRNIPNPTANASQPMMDPPTYAEAVPEDNINAYPKQAPFNPDFKSS